MTDEQDTNPAPSSPETGSDSPSTSLDDNFISGAQVKYGRGRPSSYKPEYCKQAYKMCLLLNATDAELAKFFEVSVDTITEWKRVHSDFSSSIKKGKEEADAKVAKRLFDRASGYKIKKTVIDNKGTEHHIEDNVLPDVTAQIFWLKNRQPEKWRDRHQVSIEDPDKVLAEVLNVKPEDLPE